MKRQQKKFLGVDADLMTVSAARGSIDLVVRSSSSGDVLIGSFCVGKSCAEHCVAGARI